MSFLILLFVSFFFVDCAFEKAKKKSLYVCTNVCFLKRTTKHTSFIFAPYNKYLRECKYFMYFLKEVNIKKSDHPTSHVVNTKKRSKSLSLKN